MDKLAIVILAAGKSTRMKSNLVKVLHPLMGMPMLSFLIETVKNIGSNKIVVVIGYQGGLVRERFKGEALTFVEQKEQNGTGHAVLCVREDLKGFTGDVLILCGDVPLIRKETIEEMIAVHRESNSKITVLTTKLNDPMGYGRIVRGENGEVLRIVEEKDADDIEREVREVNTGIYCVKAEYLFETLIQVGRENKQSEYYLTDIVAISTGNKVNVMGFLAEDPFEVMGINDREEMAKANEVIKKRILVRLMKEGISIIDPQTTFIERNVRIGKDTVIYPNCFIQGNSTIGEECVIEAGSVIIDSRIGDRVVIRPYCVINDSCIADEVRVGPFAHLRPETELEAKVKIGSFVEVKKSGIGEESKAKRVTKDRRKKKT